MNRGSRNVPVISTAVPFWTAIAMARWVPGHMAVYYVSYKLNHADIFYHDLSTGARRAFARFGGSNMSPGASRGGS